MRILCDQNVSAKYIEAFQRADFVTVTTVADALKHDVKDKDISAYAEREEWVVFTNDDDFFVAGGDHGLLLYDQIEDPDPGEILAAVQQIKQVYADLSDIVEKLPGEWI